MDGRDWAVVDHHRHQKERKMASFSEKLVHLEKLVETSADLAEPFKYFMDHIGLDPGFMSESSRTKNNMVQKIIQKALKHYFNLTFNATQCMIMEYKNLKTFHHGTCFMSGHSLVFFHFTKINTGMIAMSDMQSGMNHFFRFRAIIANGEMTFHPGDPTVRH
ncbi:MAG: hypothetical protein HQL76_00760 [Magnetococcales bacterium]|nr:hypothetical protein [Magnetococcales bacterium]